MTVENCTFRSGSSDAAAMHRDADALLEIRRYVKSDPEYIARTLPHMRVLGFRSMDNIHVGLAYIHADPEVLESYLYAAAFEIRAAALREENANA